MLSNELNPHRAFGIGVPFEVAWNFTTDIYGDETLVQSHNGQITCVRTTNTYVFTIKEAGVAVSWDTTDAVLVTHNLESTVNVTVSSSASAGTVTLAFSTDFDSGVCSVVLKARVNT